MAAQKRALDDQTSARKAKKTKINADKTKQADSLQKTSSLVMEDMDFPRGGGTTFTPLEVKNIRAEVVKEVNQELFEESQQKKKARKRKGKNETTAEVTRDISKNEKLRIEQLNYKRLNIGMKIFGQIVAIQPLFLIISLPSQLFAHVPITNISTQLTAVLESEDEYREDSELEADDDDSVSKPQIPDLADIFYVGQYVRTVVTAVHAPGSSDMSGMGKQRDELSRASRRVELSLEPEKVNVGVQKEDLKPGFTLTAAVKSIEDHGYIFDMGIPDVSAFLSFKTIDRNKDKFCIGQLLDVVAAKLSTNGRILSVEVDKEKYASSSLSEVSSVTSVLPGSLVQSLITAVHPEGLNVQILGFFDGTVDQLQFSSLPSGKPYKIGKKVKARVLYNYSTSPPRFALSLNPHIVGLGPRLTPNSSEQKQFQETYPVGTILDSVKVLRVESERGIFVEIEPGLEGFIHISHLLDDHVVLLSSSSGPWKVGTIHRARVTGFFAFDGLLQLSLKPSVLEQKFLQVSDIEVGEVVKGTIKKLTDTALFVSLSGSIDGVIWPNHYADIVLKHPAKRFKVGSSIKCRVLFADSVQKRIFLTAKKTLVESTLPVLSQIEKISPGVITHAVVFKVHEKHLLVEFYNNIKAVVTAREASDTPVNNLSVSFPIGRVVRVRIISVQQEEGKIMASIRQASPKATVSNINDVEIGNIVEGSVTEIHKENAVIALEPSQVRALISLKNLANYRGLPLPQLRLSLKVGDKLEELVVVTRNPEKGFVIVANKPKTKAALPTKGTALTMETIVLGQMVGGRVTRHARQGTLVKLTSHIGGILHPTDVSDNYDASTPFPPVDSILKAVVVGIDQSKRQLTLSTRHSKMYPDQPKEVADREITSINDLQVGDTVKGFIKSVAEHGLFVTIGREIDARVQIRELFDEYIKDWKPRFQANQLVKGRILGIDADKKRVELSFRSGDLSKCSGASGIHIGDLREGQKIDGTVKKIEDYGLFIQIDGSKLNGLCHKSQLSDNKEADVSVALRGFREGDRVKAVIIGIENRKISLSIKPSHFGEEDFNESENDSNVEGQPNSFGVVDDAVEVDEDDPMEDKENNEVRGSDGDAREDEDEDEAMDLDLNHPGHLFQQTVNNENVNQNAANGSKPVVPLALSDGFHWQGGLDQDENQPSSSSDESDQGEVSTKKKKKKKKVIEEDLTAQMHQRAPESNADFERILLGSPNSSYLWIQYMSFQLQVAEIDKAREIARRAFKTINFREEQEKLNVWIALLNLENVYGTDESLDATFKEATRSNDSKTVHLRMAAILDQSEKIEKAEKQFKKTSKKFGNSSKVWTLFGEFYLRRGQIEDARKLLPRCLQSLEKRKHLKTISRFAQLEYKYGDPERGKTLFEGIIDSHPKRWDLWSVYMDMEAGQQNIQSLRNLFVRVLVLKMTSHKAKSFFKKWLELEKRIGDEEGVKVVKEKAIEWTQRATNAS